MTAECGSVQVVSQNGVMPPALCQALPGVCSSVCSWVVVLTELLPVAAALQQAPCKALPLCLIMVLLWSTHAQPPISAIHAQPVHLCVADSSSCSTASADLTSWPCSYCLQGSSPWARRTPG
jgi:hypothetical protein